MSRLTSDKDVQDMGKPNDYQVAMKWLESHDWDGDPEADSNLATICYTLQEIGEYEDTGLTPEQVLEMDKMYQKLAGEVMAYRKVGTVEECREAVEKQKAKKPDGRNDSGLNVRYEENMNRLTSGKDVQNMNMIELAYNSCYARDGKAMYRDYDTDIDARQLAIRLLDRYADIPNEFTCDDDFDDEIFDYMSCGIENIVGLIAVFYRNLWAMADLRERLKRFEDAEEQKRLLKLPCAVGDTVYAIDEGMVVVSMKVLEIKLISLKTSDFITQIICDTGNGKVIFLDWDFGKAVFFTREQVEKALKRMTGEVG